MFRTRSIAQGWLNQTGPEHTSLVLCKLVRQCKTVDESHSRSSVAIVRGRCRRRPALTRSVSKGERFTKHRSQNYRRSERPPSLTLFEVAHLFLNPEGSQPLAGGRRRHTTGKPATLHLYPGGMTANLSLASLRDAIPIKTHFRWYRFAQPPANRCEPSRLNRKSEPSKLILWVSP